MPFEFKFLNRDDELYQLQQDFITEVIQQRKCSTYLISGRRGAGKSRLIHEFLNSLEADQRIAVNIPKFRRNVHAIEYACREDGAEPYRPFMEIKDQIERQQKGFRILRYAGMLLISFLPIHDVVDDLRKLVGEIGRGVTEEVIRSKETATFAKYLRMLKRRSKHIPIVLYIQNIQWIDDHSLKLLQTLIENEKSLWGMIILEENETPAANEKTTTIFRRLIDAQKMKRLTLKPMHKGFEIQLLEDRFRPRLFTNNELEHIYTLSEGCPGLLADLTNDWIRKGWIYQENSEWEKIPEFEHKIKVPYQKMLDLLITLLQDGMISPREQLLIDNFAQEWDIDKATVTSMIDMIMKAREIGYDIVMRTHRGTLGEDAFLAHDKDMNKFIVEYVTNVGADEKEIVPREVKHPALLASRDIKKCDDGVLIVNDFFEGKTLREVNEEAHESHVMKVLKIAVQVAEGLEELHRNGLIHGYLRPESIIVTADGEIRLSALDASQLKLSETMDTEKYLGIVSYFSPEQVKGEKQGVQSDIFSFGVLLYELLTGERPFTGANKGELKESICYKNHPDLTTIQPPIPIEVQKILEKCLQKNPEDRYQSTKILLDDLKRLIIESKIVTSEAESPGSHLTVEKVKRTAPAASRRKKILISAFAILLIACAAIYYQYFFKKSSWGFAAKTIVVEPFNVVNESDQNIGALPDMIKYLIIDDLLQSSRENVHVFSQKDFELAHDVKAEKPELIVSGALTVKDFDYELKVILSRPGEKKDVLPFSFGDPSALLKNIITDITRSILTKIGKPAQRKFMNFLDFTDRWGAFERFYEGEQAWEKLDITKADEKLRAALVYDNNFVLAKVRLAQVVLFNGSRLEAQELIHSVRPHLSLLSRLDSLRVEAIQARLEGDLFKEISILQDIYNTFPTRKEFAYDVAEAFYEICEIDKAIEYYNKALLLDENFARAHNHLAYCYSHRGQHEKALYHFRKYAKLDSTANAFDSWGDGFMAAGKLDSAVWAKKQGIQLDPRLSYLWGSLGYINIRQGKLTEAEQNIQKYIDFSDRADRKARGIFRKALVDFCRQNYAAALAGCMSAQAVYDSTDLVTRDHDLHWLLGLLYLKFNEPEFARAEIDQMEQIINLYAINDTNYRMGIYKNYLALKIFEAAYRGNEAEMLTYMERFDGPIQSKIKDHGSPFDLAYFNTTFGELLMMEPINRPDLAEARLKLALNYNPNYALAHYDLWQLYLKTGDEQKSMDHQNKFKSLWQQADEDVKGIYGL